MKRDVTRNARRYAGRLLIAILTLILMNAELLKGTDVRAVSDRIQIIDTVGNFDKERFLEAAYWAGSAFVVAKLPKIIVVYVDKNRADFICPDAPLHACLNVGANEKEAVYELWLWDNPRDGVIMTGLTKILARERGLDTDQALVLGNRALKQLQATVTVKQEKR